MTAPSTDARAATFSTAVVEPARRLTPRCPRCGEGDVRRSHARGVVERFLRWFGIVPYRCLGCDRRFFRTRGYTRAR